MVKALLDDYYQQNEAYPSHTAPYVKTKWAVQCQAQIVLCDSSQLSNFYLGYPETEYRVSAFLELSTYM